jgi:hypothetical protein
MDSTPRVRPNAGSVTLACDEAMHDMQYRDENLRSEANKPFVISKSLDRSKNRVKICAVPRRPRGLEMRYFALPENIPLLVIRIAGADQARVPTACGATVSASFTAHLFDVAYHDWQVELLRCRE